MEKKPVVDGKWVEIDANEISASSEEIGKCEILVINSARIDLGGPDKDAFAEKFARVSNEFSTETDGMDDEQRSYYIFRKMLIG
jgi:hypothetical protein